MGDLISYNPNPISNPLQPPPTIYLPESAEPRDSRAAGIKRPLFRLTTEFDSESSSLVHKASCKFFDGLAKLKFSFQNDAKGKILHPQLGFISQHLSVLYDVESRNALLKGFLDLSKELRVRTSYNFQEQLGDVAFIATFPSVKAELSTSIPSAVPRATLQFSSGEVTLERTEYANEQGVNKVLSLNGILKNQMLNGICTAMYNNHDLSLRYSYKDNEISFIPRLQFPSNALSFAFKRRFSLYDKLSYWYHFDKNEWSAVYKHTVGKDLKFKAGYDSEVRLCWASLWVGHEDGKAKAAPMKLKIQMMLQIPQDNIKKSAVLLRVKKRWDF